MKSSSAVNHKLMILGCCLILLFIGRLLFKEPFVGSWKGEFGYDPHDPSTNYFSSPMDHKKKRNVLCGYYS